MGSRSDPRDRTAARRRSRPPARPALGRTAPTGHARPRAAEPAVGAAARRTDQPPLGHARRRTQRCPPRRARRGRSRHPRPNASPHDPRLADADPVARQEAIRSLVEGPASRSRAGAQASPRAGRCPRALMADRLGAAPGIAPAGYGTLGRMPWVPELFTAPVLQQVLDKRRREQLVAVPFFDGLVAGEPDALVESFAGEPELLRPGPRTGQGRRRRSGRSSPA